MRRHRECPWCDGDEKMYLEQIRNVNDIKNIDSRAYEELAQEIRDFLIRKISVTGGHLGSNLGAVELTMALHLAAPGGQNYLGCGASVLHTQNPHRA